MIGKERRQERLNALLRNIVSSFIKSEISLGIMVTVMRVETFSDLRSAKVFISVFPEDREKEILKLLKSKLPEVHKLIKSQLKVKFLPIVSFEIDKAAKLEKEIEEILGRAT